MKAGKQVEKSKAGKQVVRKEEMCPPGGRGGHSAAGQNGARPSSANFSDGHKRTQKYEIKRRAVQLCLEEGVPVKLVAREIGVSSWTISGWVRQYRKSGEEGLHPLLIGRRTANQSVTLSKPNARALIRAEITALKRKHPAFGIKRISQTLRRIFHLSASPETVRKTLHREKLITSKKRKTPSNPSKPRFFERATPNQMWQSDIFPFKLGGEAVRPPEWLGPGGYAYLIGFIDDHSRYITALEVFRSQTADNLLEVFRRGVGAHGAPKEMLTDNGRQYASWHGKTKFQQELARNRIQHIRSSPHHPQTLGKIERFWKTIWEEFISRARFATFEEARERLRWWVQYYNHQRPHQALDGLCPSDRFYRIEQAMRDEIEKGIVANAKELALNGKPQAPFYMMGRMGDQSVTIKTEEGQVKLVVEKAEDIGDEHNKHNREETESKAGGKCSGKGAGSPGDMERTAEHIAGVPGAGSELGVAERLGAEGTPGNSQGHGRGGADIAGAGGTGPATGKYAGGTGDGEDRPAGAVGGGESGVKMNCQEEGKDYADERSRTQIQCPGAVPGGVAGVVGAQEQEGDLPGVEGQREPVGILAGEGNGRADRGADAPGGAGGGGEGPGPVGQHQAAFGEEGGGTRGPTTGAGADGGDGQACVALVTAGGNDGGLNDPDRKRGAGGASADHARGDGPADGVRSGAADGSLAQDVLSAGSARAGGHGGGVGAAACGPAGECAGHGEGSAPGATGAAPAGETGVAAALAGAGNFAESAG
ncbi:MAG: IS481 family transposase [Kiritimatiellae bacterium]|nr:IS481 family transposase [Kiritimatiellia bacterium]